MIVWNDFVNDARVRKEAETLQGAGHQVTVYALHVPGKTNKKQRLASGVSVTRVKRNPFWRESSRSNSDKVDNASRKGSSYIGTQARNILKLSSRLWAHSLILARVIAFRPNVVHAHDVNTLPTAWLASFILRVPLIYDAHEISVDREGYNSYRKVVWLLERLLSPRAQAVLTTTDLRARILTRLYSLKNVIVLQNRPRLLRVQNNDYIRKRLKLQDKYPIVLYQGGVQQGRGLEDLLEAAQSILNAYFVFIGDGRIKEHLMEICIEKGLSGRVFFIPTLPLDELLHYTASADIGVQPLRNTCLNHYTTDSNKLFEYLMAGIPVVASAMPEIRKVITQYEAGICFPPGDVDALTRALTELVTNAPLRRQFASNSYRASTHLCWEEQEYKLVELYAEL